MNVIILGGGIGGITAANALRNIGLNVRVYEQAPRPAEVGAGVGLWGNAVAALRRINVADAVLARGEHLELAEIKTAAGKLLTRSTWAEYERHGSDLFALVHRAELLEELLRPLPHGVVHFGRRGAGFQLAADGASIDALFADGSREPADLLIGADGLHSVVREQLHGPAAPRYCGYTCWRGVVNYPDPRVPPGYVGEIWGRGARFGINRMGAGRIYWWATLNTPASPPRHGLDAAAKNDLLASHGRFCDPVPDLIERTPADQILRNDIYDRRPSPKWTGPRTLLIGDAAHPTTPNLGQGACMAIEDGIVLARCLEGVREHDAPDLQRRLDAFVRLRYKKTAAVVRQSHWFGVTGQWENAMLRAARDLLTPITTKISFPSMVRRYGRLDA